MSRPGIGAEVVEVRRSRRRSAVVMVVEDMLKNLGFEERGFEE